LEAKKLRLGLKKMVKGGLICSKALEHIRVKDRGKMAMFAGKFDYNQLHSCY